MSPENLYLGRAKLVMKVLGVWLPSETEPLRHSFYRKFMVSLQYIFLIFQIIYIVQVWGDLEAVCQASYLLFTQACLCFKISVFLLNTDSLKGLLRDMNSDIFQPHSLEQECILKFQARRIKRLLFAFMVSSQTTCGLWALKPLFDDAARSFPFDMWMPVTTEKSPEYEIGYAFQLTTICMSAYMYFGVDSVALSMVIFGCAQIGIIKEKIRNIGREKNVDNDSGSMLDENYKKFTDCIEQHQAIISFIQKVENTYHSYLLFQLSGSVGLICMSALMILVVEWRSMQFFSILTYLAVMIMQLFLCCWCGHELTATSEELSLTLNECPWYEQSGRFQRALLFALLRMGRPIVFRAGHYIPLSRQTFVAILRTSYSYFAVLRQTRQN